MQISELMIATEAPPTAWLAMDTGTNVYKITIQQLKQAIQENGGN